MTISLLSCTLFLLLSGLLQAQTNQESANPFANRSQVERDARMAWFREAKFGMFNHWGVDAVPADVRILFI